MEIRDVFIVGVHNYCDRWCERCAFTSFDPDLRPIIDAPLREGRQFPAPLWIDEEELEPAPLPGVPPERQAIDVLALTYAT